ncbi:MAG: DUF2235 domain-containing protein [Pseudomonadota bacterium]
MKNNHKPETGPELHQGRKTGKRLPKRLIVFADGTGNAFGNQASNIWRIYDAVDKRGLHPLKQNQQLARYIPGVGTSSIGLIRLFDGATGFGVPSNVQKLYRFLCWNWEPGDEIWMFGFSRGAFTVRTLASLIQSQGLIPKQVDGRTVSSAEMRRNAGGAWRDYRQKTAPFRDPQSGKIRMSPTVSAGRFIRDVGVRIKRWVLRQKTHAQVQGTVKSECPERDAGNVKIKFLGLFDTVEAYGVPLEEVRAMIDFWIWPISFRNRVCSAAVEDVRHALALDDERRTYHPLRFDQTPRLDLSGPGNQTDGPRIKEVWFAGMHADIGGGYPNDEASLEPLIWMIREAEQDGLQFIAPLVDDWDSRRSKNALIHDSRSGMKSAYRYTPRPVESGDAFGGKPVVHGSVVEKILAGRDGYAPVMLTDDFLPHEQPQQVSLSHNSALAQQVKSLVMWKRVANVAFIAILLFLAALPWTDTVIRALVQPGMPPQSAASLSLPGVVTAVVPGFVQPWLQSFANIPALSIPLILLAIALQRSSTSLRDRIRDGSRTVWTSDKTMTLDRALDRLLVRTGERLRASGIAKHIYTFFSAWVIPVALAALVLLGVVKVVQVTGLTVTTVAGNLCPQPGLSRGVEPGEVYETPGGFSPREVCWSSGVDLVEGRTYWIRLEELVPFSDEGQRVPMSGFETSQRSYVFGKLIRRTGTSWFQPVAQIGRVGSSIVPLENYSGKSTHFMRSVQGWPVDGVRGCEGVDQKTPVITTVTARVRAEKDGHLFLYVNDMIFWPFMNSYAGNGGCARLTIKAEESPI